MQQVLLETPPSDEVGREPEGVCKLKWPKLAQNAGYFNPNFHQKIDRTRSNSIIINGFSSARVCFRFNISLKDVALRASSGVSGLYAMLNYLFLHVF